MPKLNTSRQRAWIKKRKRTPSIVDNSNFYNSRQWRRLRQYIMQMNPLCKHCEDKGLIKAGECIDHIIPIRLGGDKLNTDNLQTLCNSCHAIKSGKEAHVNRYDYKK